MAESSEVAEVLARFEELAVLEAEFEDVELEIIRKSNTLNVPLWKKRADIVAKIPHFWTLVFEQVPPELENFLQPSDNKVFEALQTVEVSRFDIDNPDGSPRSFSIKFGFSDNEYFENKELEKKFWYRVSKDGWEGHVSEPVKINWKKGKDLTEGLTDAAYKLAQSRSKLGNGLSPAASLKKQSGLPEYKTLAAKIEESTEASLSFFTWFGFVSSFRYVSAEESAEAIKDELARLEKLKRGEKPDEEEDDDEESDVDFQETEVFPQGDVCATLIAEDVWPSALRYYKAAHEADDEDLSELDVDDMMEDDSDEEVDIRGLVGKGRKASDSPPSKKRRNA
ncbi:hypothetical protein P280DRAFT_15575 [Massarina eburnea CBS 473.64]|uniref:NAP family protein n=1 Tax=Massarina eburnea CBS 473.64 TaxID=1395130 RepID=A0A6A6SGH6_9PLEO|nr:hypothetical protein P280DRAFT_15575 [Massarina eburnea CBS 473.64]